MIVVVAASNAVVFVRVVVVVIAIYQIEEITLQFPGHIEAETTTTTITKQETDIIKIAVSKWNENSNWMEMKKKEEHNKTTSKMIF